MTSPPAGASAASAPSGQRLLATAPWLLSIWSWLVQLGLAGLWLPQCYGPGIVGGSWFPHAPLVALAAAAGGLLGGRQQLDRWHRALVMASAWLALPVVPAWTWLGSGAPGLASAIPPLLGTGSAFMVGLAFRVQLRLRPPRVLLHGEPHLLPLLTLTTMGVGTATLVVAGRFGSWNLALAAAVAQLAALASWKPRRHSWPLQLAAVATTASTVLLAHVAVTTQPPGELLWHGGRLLWARPAGTSVVAVTRPPGNVAAFLDGQIRFSARDTPRLVRAIAEALPRGGAEPGVVIEERTELVARLLAREHASPFVAFTVPGPWAAILQLVAKNGPSTQVTWLEDEPVPWLRDHPTRFAWAVVAEPEPLHPSQAKYFTKYFHELLRKRLRPGAPVFVIAGSLDRFAPLVAQQHATAEAAGWQVTVREAALPTLGAWGVLQLEAPNRPRAVGLSSLLETHADLASPRAATADTLWRGHSYELLQQALLPR